MVVRAPPRLTPRSKQPPYLSVKATPLAISHDRAPHGPRKALRGGISKVNFLETLSSFGDGYPQNGSNTAPTAPRPHLGYPHEGPSVGPRTARSPSDQLAISLTAHRKAHGLCLAIGALPRRNSYASRHSWCNALSSSRYPGWA